MTLQEIKSLVVSLDVNAGHYESAYQGSPAYTVWREVRPLPIMGDNRHAAEAWRFQIDRFTKSEDDEIAVAIRASLEGDPRVACSYDVDYEPGTGYIHHIYDCEGI